MLPIINLADTGVEYGPPIIFTICWTLDARADAARMNPPEFGYRPLWGTCAETVLVPHWLLLPIHAGQD
jgi:hypothetical protein